jgi:hypothetical protein
MAGLPANVGSDALYRLAYTGVSAPCAHMRRGDDICRHVRAPITCAFWKPKLRILTSFGAYLVSSDKYYLEATVLYLFTKKI